MRKLRKGMGRDRLGWVRAQMRMVLICGLALLVGSATLHCHPGGEAEDTASLAGGREESTVERATFAAGCFWGVEAAFRQVRGVVDTQVGYTGGTKENPKYADVCTDTTGHAEAVEVTFDPELVTYRELLKVFWDSHDPTQIDRQGPDVGSQYRSAIFYHNATQEMAARASKKELEESGRYSSKIVTEILPASVFYRAGEYHQRYLEKRGLGSCGLH